MKRNLLLLIVLCCTMTMLAQNGKISYQAVVRDSENHLVYDTPLQVTVSLANSETGTAVYSEQHAVTSNANGLISLLIGDGENKQGHWENVQWNTAWVTATIRKASDQTFLAEHHLPLSAVPYALYADFADSVNLAVLQDYLDEHHYVTEDELPAVQANADWTETNPDTASYIKNKPDLNDYEKKSELCGDVKECIKDTLGKYTTSNQIDTLLGAYYDTTHTKSVISDTATALRAMMGDAAYNSKITLKKNNVELDSFRLNQQTDKAINIPVPTTVAELSDAGNYVTKTKLNDTLGAYYDTANVKQMLKPYLKANELCDSIVKCDVIKDMRDSIRDNAAAIQTNATNIGFNKQAIIDSSAHIRNEIKYGQITIALNRGSETGVTNPTFGVNQADTQIVTINIPEATTVNNGQLTLVAAGDTTRFTANQATNDTMRLNKFATKDTLAYYATTSALKDSLSHYVGKEMLNDTLSHYTTTNQLDTVIRKYGYVTNAHLNDTLAAVYNTIRTDSTALHKAIKDTAAAIRGDICDSATACITKALAEPNSNINHAIDTIARNNIHDTAQAIRAAIHDSLSSYKIKDCGDVTTCVNAALIDGASATNHAIDSIAGNVIHDSIVNNISKQIHDSIGNITIPTAVTELSDAGNYLKTSDLCSTIESNCTNVTLKNAVNNFSGKNHFADSVTVPSNTSIPRPATAEHSCTDNVASAVNICDLLAVFDSLTNRIKKLEDEVNALKSAMPPVFNSLTLSDSTATTMKVTTAFTSTGIPISEYQYCYSKNSDMSAPSCTTSTSNSITLTGLDPYTRYYVTVSAVNVAGTTTSVIENARTLAYAPTASIVNVAEHKPIGFQVNVSGLDFKEPAVSGTVQICYKLKGNDECVVDPTNTYADYGTCEPPQNATNTTDIAKIINENIELDEAYCVIVKVSNADSTTIYGPYSITPANVTFTVEGPQSVTYHCGLPEVAPQYTATLSSGESADDYTFSWTGGTAEITDQATYNPTLSENTTVTCTATHKTLNYQLSGSVTTAVTIASVSPVIALCTEELTVTDKGSTNIDSVKWSDDETSFTLTNSVGYTYTTDGVYTITAKNTANCVATRQVIVGKVTIQPCTAPSTHVAQNLISGNDGKETVDANGKVVKVKDYDGHSYSVVQIGNQCWMAENLRTTHYGDGTDITQDTVASSAARYYIPKNGNQDLNDSIFGLLYNWYAATRINNANDGLSEGKQGVCPQGWHVPTQSDWTTMETYVNGGTPLNHTIGNMSGDIAGQLAKGCDWASSETEKASGNYAYSDRNATGLGIVPAGRFTKANTYTNYGLMAEFWVSYGGVNSYPYSWDITNSSPGTRLDYSNETDYKKYALSVRCVRDETYNPISVTYSTTSENVSICPEEATEVTYTALILEGTNNIADHYNYSWSVTPLNNAPADGALISSPAPTGSTCTVTFSKVGSYEVTYTTTNSNLTASTISNVDYKPIPSFDEPVVSGRTVTLNNIDVDTIKWYSNGPKEIITTSPATHTYNENGTYTITATKTNGCSTSVGEVNVSLTLAVTSSGDTSICTEGNTNTNTVITYTAVVNDNGTTPATGYEFTWSLSSTEGAALSSTSGSSVTVSYSAANSYKVYCTASKSTGNVSDSVQTIIASATPTFTTPTIAEGIVTLNNLTNTNQITWDKNNANATTIVYDGYPTSATYTYTDPGVHNYTIVAKNKTGNCIKEVTVGVTVPQVSFQSPATQNVSICPNQAKNISYTALIMEGTVDISNNFDSYSWSVTPLNNSPADGATIPSPAPTDKTCTVTFSQAGSYNVSYTAHKSGSNDLTATLTATVTSPIPSFDNPTVSGRTVTLSNLQYVNTVEWGDGNSTSNITDEQISHTYESNSTGDGYTITATNTDGCSTTTNVPVSLTLGITAEGTTSICTAGNTNINTEITYTAAVIDIGTTTATDYTYTWHVTSNDVVGFENQDIISENNSLVFTYNIPGTYIVSCTASATTGDASYSVETEITALATPSLSSTNPVSVNDATVTLNDLSYTNRIIWDNNNTAEDFEGYPSSAQHTYTGTPGDHTYTIVTINIATNCNNSAEATVTIVESPTLDAAPGISNITANSMKVTPHFSGTISSYTYCISTNSNMSEASCVTTTANTYEFTELSGNTTYYVKVTATNSGGATPSDVVSAHTLNNTVDLKFSCIVSGTLPNGTLPSPISWDNNSNSTYIYETGRTFGDQVTVLDSVRDYEGYWYKVVQIGTQCWLKENMRATRYSSGNHASITRYTLRPTDRKEYLELPKQYCWAPGQNENNIPIYGLYYNWGAAMNISTSTNPAQTEGLQGICPMGWHIPSLSEWETMETYVDATYDPNYDNLGYITGILSSSQYWVHYSTSNTTLPRPSNVQYPSLNDSGFSALPAGCYYATNNTVNGPNLTTITNTNTRAQFWTSTLYSGDNSGTCLYWTTMDNIVQPLHGESGSPYAAASSVRCVRD